MTTQKLAERRRRIATGGRKIKILRADVRIAREWLKQIHPYVNASYGIRKNGIFPTDRATIHRYFEWCSRHHFDPKDTTNCCLYWGVSEPHTIGTIKCHPIFTKINVAWMEKRLGSSTTPSPRERLLRTAERKSISPGYIPHEAIDRWSAVVEWIATDEKYISDPNNYLEEGQYNEYGDRRGFVKGRVVKRRIEIRIATIEQHAGLPREGERSHASVFVKPSIEFSPRVMWGNRITAKTTLEASRDTSWHDMLWEAGNLLISKHSRMPHITDTLIRMQPYTYQTKQQQQLRDPYHREHRQENRRRARHAKRAKIRERASKGPNK